MSGGHFDHVQYHIAEIADGIDELVRKPRVAPIGEEEDMLRNPRPGSLWVVSGLVSGLRSLECGAPSRKGYRHAQAHGSGPLFPGPATAIE